MISLNFKWVSVMTKTKTIMQWFQTLSLSDTLLLHNVCVSRGFEWLAFVLTPPLTPAKHSHARDCASCQDIPLIFIHHSVTLYSWLYKYLTAWSVVYMLPPRLNQVRLSENKQGEEENHPSLLDFTAFPLQHLRLDSY